VPGIEQRVRLLDERFRLAATAIRRTLGRGTFVRQEQCSAEKTGCDAFDAGVHRLSMG
jgi:hypothetical protein